MASWLPETRSNSHLPLFVLWWVLANGAKNSNVQNSTNLTAERSGIGLFCTSPVNNVLKWLLKQEEGKKRPSLCYRDGAESYSLDPDVWGLHSVDFLKKKHMQLKAVPPYLVCCSILHLELDWENVVCENMGWNFLNLLLDYRDRWWWSALVVFFMLEINSFINKDTKSNLRFFVWISHFIYHISNLMTLSVC